MKSVVTFGAVLLIGLMQSAPQFTVPAGKSLPFRPIAPTTDPMAACNAGGQDSMTHPTAAKQRESSAKNNLWVTGPATPIDFNDLDTLQSAVTTQKADGTFTYPNFSNAPSRAQVEQARAVAHGSVGEGSLVKIVAHMKDAHIADCTADQPGRNGGPGRSGEHGEEVNCNLIGVQANDFHITLMPLDAAANASECVSATAEMIPHFRPTAWQTLDQRTPTRQPVRVTGTLFYDDSHQPCNPRTHAPAGRGSPARRAVWEIHPVYQLEVCTAGNVQQCTATNDAAWTPYDKWLTMPGANPVVTDQGGARASCNTLSGGRPVAPAITTSSRGGR